MQKEHAAEWMVIVNPNAGSGRGEKDWMKISGLLSAHHFSFEQVFTRSQKHAISLTHECICKGYRKFVIVGGDGTINEVVNGVFTQDLCPSTEITLAMITVGTGNDWGKMYGIPYSYEQAIGIIVNHKTRLQDIGIVEYFNDSQPEKRYFLNIAGLGFDAIVVKRTNLQKEKGKKGKAIYFINLLKSLLQYSHTHVNMEIDGKKESHDVFTISIGIGRFSGGGMKQTPLARPDDGILDMTVVKKIGKAEIILSLKKLYDGSILNHPKIEGFSGKEIRIESDPPVCVEADGESLGYSPVHVKIIPRCINIVYGQFPE